jgi:hypothetical protein
VNLSAVSSQMTICMQNSLAKCYIYVLVRFVEAILGPDLFHKTNI